MEAMTGIAGRRILIIEDEMLLAMDLEQFLQGCGAEVLGPVPTIEQALEFLSRQRPDAATLDMNLHGTPSLPIANELADLEIPFVVISGYSNCYAESAAFRNARFLKKPYKERELLEAFAELL
jgi:DNA-binding NtrC family response regulator